MKTVSAVKREPSSAIAQTLVGKNNIFKRFWKTRFLFLLFIPALVYYIMFHYIPMWGITFSFYKYDLWNKMAGSEWMGLANFQKFFMSPDCWMVTRNTLALGLQSLFISFPVTVVFALLLNEVRNLKFKKIVQTVSYMPHFLSVVVVCGLITSLLDLEGGAVNTIIQLFGGEPIYFMNEKSWFRPIWLISEIWQTMGWGTIVYLAAIASVDPALYEAARLDGASRFRQIISITLPAIAPTVATMFILKVGAVMSGSMEKALLLQTSGIYEVSEIVSTYVYTKGIVGTDYGFSTAVGLYQSFINLVLLLLANWTSKKVTETGII